MKNWPNYIKFLFWKYLKFTRPSNIEINGKFIFTSRTKIVIDSNSIIKIRGNADLSDSEIILSKSSFDAENVIVNNTALKCINSSLNFGNLLHIKKSNLVLEGSSLSAHDNFRMHHYLLSMFKSQFELSNHFFFDGNAGMKNTIQMNNGKLFGGTNTRVQSEVYVENANLQIGSNTFINRGNIVNCCEGIEIGNFVMISYDCVILDNNSHSTDHMHRRKEINDGFPNGTKQTDKSNVRKAPIKIGDDVWIGMRSMILKGVVIGEKSIIAAGMCITKNVEKNTITYHDSTRAKKIE